MRLTNGIIRGVILIRVKIILIIRINHILILPSAILLNLLLIQDILRLATAFNYFIYLRI